MKKLEKFYELRDGNKDLGLPVSKIHYAEAEQRILQEELIPKLKELLSPLLNKVKRDLTILVDHSPGEPLILDFDLGEDWVEDVIFSDTPEEIQSIGLNHLDIPNNKKSTRKKHKKGPWTNFTIVFPNGTKIYERNAKDTFILALEKIGLEKIIPLEIITSKLPLVSRENIDSKKQTELKNGYYMVAGTTSTAQKMKIIKQISDELNLELKIAFHKRSEAEKLK